MKIAAVAGAPRASQAQGVVVEFNEAEFRLPYPPTVNHYFTPIATTRGTGRFVLGAAGTQFRHDAGVELMRQKVLTSGTTKRVEVWLTYHAPNDKSDSDLDNRVKPVFDVLTKFGFWRDDGQIDRFHVDRGDIRLGDGHVLVRVRAL